MHWNGRAGLLPSQNTAICCVNLGTHVSGWLHIVAVMKIHSTASNRRQWYHVICALHRNRALLKIPATARFCEQAIVEACSAPSWTVDTVAASPTQIRLLLIAPAGMERGSVIHAVQRAATKAVLRSGAIPPGHKVWGEKAWCFAIRTDAGVVAVRKLLSELTTSGTNQPSQVPPISWPNQKVFS